MTGQYDILVTRRLGSPCHRIRKYIAMYHISPHLQ